MEFLANVRNDGASKRVCILVNIHIVNRSQMLARLATIHSIFIRTVSSHASIICLIDASSRVATHHLDDLDLFTFLF